jgi:hypothetical protein
VEQAVLVALPDTAPPCLVRHSPARRRQQPRFGHAGNAGDRPVREGRGEGVREGLLRHGHVVCAAGEKGEEAAIAVPRHPLGFDPRLRQGVICHNGRTSIAPWAAPGQRAAHSIAASRVSASMR